jgi:hypothetical protein
MSYWAAGTAIVASIGSTIYSADQQSKAAGAQRDAQAQALKQANQQADQAQQAQNAANQKKPDVSGILAATQAAGKAGGAGTLLTGTGGVDASGLNLGKSTLLGG